jgi:Ca-activated chloride channel family protein
MEFETISWIVAVVAAAGIVPAMIVHHRRGRGRAAVRFSSMRSLRRVPPTFRHRLRPVVPTLRVMAVVLLLVAFARPRKGDEVTEVATQGVAIQMVLDRSGSMVRYEMPYEGEWRTRLEVVQDVFKAFVLGDGKDLPGRRNDLVGLTTFARYAEEECPLTLDHGSLAGFVDTLVAATGQENMTAIGDGLYQAVLSLIIADDYVRETYGREDEYRITSKVIILLTDGEWNAGEHSPREAARFAAENGIKIYTVAIAGGQDRERQAGILGAMLRERIDTADIRRVAEITGGLYQEATDGESLRRIYEKIDALERSEFRETFRRYDERYQLPALVALGALLLEILLACTWFRKIP